MTKIVNNKIVITGEYFSKYATVMIHHPKQDPKLRYYGSFWVWDKPSSITFKTIGDRIDLKSPRMTNAYEVGKLGQDQLETFMAPVVKDCDDFYFANQQKIADGDTAALITFATKTNRLDQRRLEFIKANSQLYFSFYLFRINAIKTDVNIDTLIKIYHTYFSPKLRSSQEGQMIIRFLQARKLSKGMPAPLFVAKDIVGKNVFLKDFRGKIVLINFWASWCGSCIEKIPEIKKIKATYPSDQLEIVFITTDTDLKAYQKAVLKNNITWISLSKDTKIEHKYGVVAVPATFLIDTKGNILYNSEQLQDSDLKELKSVIAQNIRP